MTNHLTLYIVIFVTLILFGFIFLSMILKVWKKEFGIWSEAALFLCEKQ